MTLRRLRRGMAGHVKLMAICLTDLSSVPDVVKWVTLLLLVLTLWCAPGVIRKGMWREFAQLRCPGSSYLRSVAFLLMDRDSISLRVPAMRKGIGHVNYCFSDCHFWTGYC
jgi:hypothetical protein